MVELSRRFGAIEPGLKWAEQYDVALTLLNPLVLIEVLSESTEDYDRGSKFERYSHIPSFREYICVAQDRVYVEHHVRDRTNPAMWTMQRLERLNEQVTISLPLLDSGSISISLEDIYDDLELGMPEKEARK